MRTRDVYACWPFFVGDATPDQVRSRLPSMTVPNSRRRADEFGQSSSDHPNVVDEQLNLSSDEENELSIVEETVSRLGDGQREPESQAEEERVLQNPVVEDLVPQLEDEGERELAENWAEEKSKMTCPICNVFKATTTVTAMSTHIESCFAQVIVRKEKWQMEKGLSSKKCSIAEIPDGGNNNVEGVGIEIKKKKKKEIMKKKSKVVGTNMMIMREKNPPLNNDDDDEELLAANKEGANQSIEQTCAARSRTVEGNGSEKGHVENCDSLEKQREEEEEALCRILESTHKHSNHEKHCDEAQVPRSENHVEFSGELSQPNVLVSSLANWEANGNNADNNTSKRKEVVVIAESSEEQFSNAVAAQNLLMKPYNTIQDKSSSSCMVSANMIGSLLFSTQQLGNNKGIFSSSAKLGTNNQCSDLVVSPPPPTTVRLMGKDLPIDETTRKRPGSADLVDGVTIRPNNKLPNTGQRSRDDARS